MFFNESLYLEADDIDTAPMTDEEIEQAAADAKGEPVQEGYEFYQICLEGLSILDESYYNLREKMMNVEHVAALKAKDGLVSESEMLLEASVDEFLDKVKAFFVKLKNFIKELFNKFVNFIMGLFVSVKDIKGVKVDDAWKKFDEKSKKSLKVNLMNLKSADMKDAVTKANTLAADAEKSYSDLFGTYKSIKDKDDADTFEKILTRPTKYRDRVRNAKNGVEQYLVGMTEGGKTVVVKSETDISKEIFEERVKYVIAYKDTINAVKNAKDAAHKSLDKAIKDVQQMKDANEHQKKVQGKLIAEYRYMGSNTSKVFSKLCSLCSAYYRESLAVARRVIGTSKAQDAKDKWDSYANEGFNIAAYFAD